MFWLNIYMKTKRSFEEKPYSRCLWCPKRRSQPRKCKGPRTGGLPTETWRELMRDIKDVDDLTFQEIASRTNGLMSAQSVQNVLAPGATRDLTRETARIIEAAIMGDDASRPCPFDFIEHEGGDKFVADLEDEILRLHRDIEMLHQSYREELATVRADDQKKINHLLSENERQGRIIDRLLDK